MVGEKTMRLAPRSDYQKCGNCGADYALDHRECPYCDYPLAKDYMSNFDVVFCFVLVVLLVWGTLYLLFN
jgi:hypothetical protein